jgi:hypothetical protein
VKGTTVKDRELYLTRVGIMRTTFIGLSSALHSALARSQGHTLFARVSLCLAISTHGSVDLSQTWTRRVSMNPLLTAAGGLQHPMSPLAWSSESIETLQPGCWDLAYFSTPRPFIFLNVLEGFVTRPYLWTTYISF